MRQAHPRGALPEGASTPNQQTLRTIEHERNALVVEQRRMNATALSRNGRITRVTRNGKRVRESAQVPNNLRRKLFQQRQQFGAHART